MEIFNIFLTLLAIVVFIGFLMVISIENYSPLTILNILLLVGIGLMLVILLNVEINK